MTVTEDDSRRGGPGEAPAELEEGRKARELAETIDGKPGAAPDEEGLAAAAQLAASRTPELSGRARARIGDELFGPTAAARPSLRGWAVAAGVLLVAGVIALVGLGGAGKPHAPGPSGPPAQERAERGESSDFHRKAERLIAEMMPRPTAAERAQAIAELAQARLSREAAP